MPKFPPGIMLLVGLLSILTADGLRTLLVIAVIVVVEAVLYTVAEFWLGESIGHRLCWLRKVVRGGKRAGFAPRLRWNLCYRAMGLLSFLPCLWMDEGGRNLCDRVSGVWVIVAQEQ